MISSKNGASMISRPVFISDRVDEAFSRKLDLSASSSSSSSLLQQFNKSHEADDDARLALAHQLYKAGDFKQALEHSNMVYQKNPLRTDNLLLLGAIYYQLQVYDMCIKRNKEALCIQPQFAECYGNMANAWKEKGDTDSAIHYYLIAIEVVLYQIYASLFPLFTSQPSLPMLRSSLRYVY